MILNNPVQSSLEIPGSPQRVDSMISKVFFSLNNSVIFYNIPTLEEFKQTLVVIGKAKSAPAEPRGGDGKSPFPRAAHLTPP